MFRVQADERLPAAVMSDSTEHPGTATSEPGIRPARDPAHAGERRRWPDGPTAGPAYERIVNTLTSRIARGVYRPGGQLPTERQLRDEFSVSPMTVRRAVNILIDRGLVTTTRGRGTFVRSLDLGEAVFRLQEVTDQWASGGEVDVQLLEASIIPATAEVAAVLKIAAGARTVYLRRLLLREEVPIVYHREHLIYDETRPLVEALLQVTSLEGLLRGTESAGLPSGDLTIQATALGSRAAELLRMPPGSPAFCLEHVFNDFDGKPVSWGWFLCRSDLFRLSTHVGADRYARGHEEA